MLLTVQDIALVSQEVRRFAEVCTEGFFQEFIAKPTHLSNAEGVAAFSCTNEADRPDMVEFLDSHLETFMNKKAREVESQARQSLRPGSIALRNFQSGVGFP